MRHSELTTDLHYARLRTFTGNPATITPDFFDQILTATDTNKVYRATGTNQGQLVELSPPPVLPEQRVLFDESFPDPQSQTQLLVRVDQNRIYRANGILPTDWLEIVGADGGGSGGGSSAISVGTNQPQNSPTVLGEQYFDSRNNHLFIAIADGANLIWRNTTPPILLQSNGLSSPDLSAYPNAYGDWTWYFADLHPPYSGYAPFIDLDPETKINVGADLLAAIAIYGCGCYAVYFDLQDPDGLIANWEMQSFGLSFFNNVEASNDRQNYVFNAQLNGKQTKGFYFSPLRRTTENISYGGYVSIY